MSPASKNPLPIPSLSFLRPCISFRFLLVLLFVYTSFNLHGQITELAANNSLSGVVSNDGSKCLMTNFDGQLCTTNGTVAGTKKFTDKVLTSFTRYLYIDYKGSLLFSGYSDIEGLSLWKTDGTDAGTQLVKRFSSGVDPNFQLHFISFNNKIYFFAKTAETGYELWVTDGTASGTQLVKDINPGPEGSLFVQSQDFPFFASDSGFTSLTKDLLYFQADDGIHGQELWKTDGTAAGTQLVKDINPGAEGSFPGSRSTLGNDIIFWANDLEHGIEIWKTDGTEAGTQLVKDILPGPVSSNPDGIFKFKNKLYFRLITPEYGAELWCTDGTASGTVLFKDFIPGPADSNPMTFKATLFADRFILPVIMHPDVNIEKLEYWVSDGTSAGTKKLFGNFKTIIPFQDHYDKNSDKLFLNQHPPFNGKIFFYGEDAQTSALYITDGVSYQVVKTLSILSFGYFYTDTELQFFRSGSGTDNEYWKSDGSSTGTVPFKTWPGSGSSGYTGYDFFFQNKLYFHNDNGDNPATKRTDFLVIGDILVSGVRWIGNISTDWSNGSNWSGGKSPGEQDAVVIPANTSFDPTIPAGLNIAIKSLQLEAGAKMTVSPTAHLRVLQ